MEEKRVKRNTNKKTTTSKKVTKKNNTNFKGNKKIKVKPIIIVDWTFLVSLVLSIIFGMQTNSAFLLPFTITLVITLVCMGIILVNSIYSKIKKRFSKKNNS